MANEPITLTSTQTTALPSWYQNYAADVLSKQSALAERPYTTYQGPRVADFTPTQQQGFQQTIGSATSFRPELNAASQATQGALQKSALDVAQPYLGGAAQTSVANIGQYMNPYTESVVNRLGELGGRTLREKLLPEISDRFIGAGQFGGSRQAEAVGRALRDVSESTLAKQAEVLQSGYTGAQAASAADLARLGTLAGTAGSLSGQDISRQLTGAGALQSIAQQRQAQEQAGGTAVTGVGAQEQALGQKNLDLAYSDFLRQQGYPQEQINAMVAASQGVANAIPKTTTETRQEQVGAQAPSGAATAASILASIKALLG